MSTISEVSGRVSSRDLELETVSASQEVTSVATTFFSRFTNTVLNRVDALWFYPKIFKAIRSEQEIEEIYNFLNEWDESKYSDQAFNISIDIREYLSNGSTTLSLTRSNCIEELPSIIFKLKEVTELFVLCDNKNIPKNLFNFPNLKTIAISCNMGHIPPEIRELKSSLTDLDLTDCDIEYVPEWISELTNLKALNLSKNPLKNLPKSIGKLKKLEKLGLFSVVSFIDLEKALLSLPPTCKVFVSEGKLSQSVLESILKVDPYMRASFKIHPF